MGSQRRKFTGGLEKYRRLAENRGPRGPRHPRHGPHGPCRIATHHGKARMSHPSIRGRGAAHNPPNRFDKIEVEREAWVEAEDPAPETQFFKDTTRTIIARNDSPDVGFEASVNPYRGCDRGCVYCMWGGTPILMADGTTKPLAHLNRGDEIYGVVRRGRVLKYRKTQVLHRWETTKPARRITLEDGTELVASGDHRFLTRRGWKFVTEAEW